MKTTLSPADLVVLSFLEEEAMHGYRIVAELDRRDAKDWVEISRPQVYYSLKKLVKLGFIIPARDADEALGPEREMCQVSKKGTNAMNDSLSEISWAKHRPPPPFLTWMALSSHVSSATTKKIIEARREFLMRELEREIKTLQEFGSASDKMITAGRLMVSLTVEHFRTEFNWLEKVLRELPDTRQ